MSRPCDNCGADISVCFDCDLYKGKLVEQKVGKWVMSSYGEHKCSKCGRWAGDEEHLSTKEKEKKLTRFCPNCGAKMEGAEE